MDVGVKMGRSGFCSSVEFNSKRLLVTELDSIVLSFFSVSESDVVSEQLSSFSCSIVRPKL